MAIESSKQPRLLTYVTYTYLLRVPIVTAIVLVLFPFVALYTDAAPMLRGLLDVLPSGMFVLTLAAYATAWTVLITCWLTLAYGSRRFDIEKTPLGFPVPRAAIVLFGLLPLPIMLAAAWYSHSASGQPRLGIIAWEAAGFLIAVALLWLTFGITVRKDAPPGARLSATVRRTRLHRAIDWLGRRPYLSAGFIERVEGQHRVLPGHGVAFVQFIVSALLYVAIGSLGKSDVGYPTVVPTLAYLLILLMMLCWGMAALAFFGDRYRIPVLVTALAIPTLTAQCPASDHVYDLVEPVAATLPTPAQALEATGGTRVIVAAANGGGIQAAAWTTRALVELELKCRTECAAGSLAFARALRFVSSVSGGSVGAMYFLSRYDGVTGALPPEDDLRGAIAEAEASSLDSVAWGFVYRDLSRAFWPWWPNDPRSDRGFALQRAWMRGSRQDELGKPLSRWRAGVIEGRRPAVSFNATNSGTGERLMLATTRMLPRRGRRSFAELYSEFDVTVATAARLSATFPYVSPAARAERAANEPHVVDGGYYDNYGIATLAEWLDEALGSEDRKVTEVLVLQLRSAPIGIVERKEAQHGWFYQTFAPIVTMVNVRTAGQFSHAELELELLKRAWAGRVAITSAVCEFRGDASEDGRPDTKPPLSWHLTRNEKERLAAQWRRMADDPNCGRRVIDFLNRP